jgi:hypothetical protein
MGKSSLILVFGLSLIIAFIILKINSNATQGVETTVNKFDQTHARLIANSAVEIQLEKLRVNKNLSGNFSGNLFDGSYSGNISIPDANDRIIISSTGVFQGVSRYVRVDAERKDVTTPIMSGAMTISTNAFTDKLNITGTQKISGFEHDTDGKEITPSLNPVPGITVDTPGQIDTLVKNMSGKSVVEGKGPLVPLASPKYSISQAIEYVDWQKISEDIASSADTVIIQNGPITNFNIGTLSLPKIVRIDGNISLPAGGTGAGILVINGSVTINGGFTWKGLILAYKNDSTIEIKLNGGATIIGGMILTGPQVKLLASGGNNGFELLYSSQVLQLLQNNLVSSRFKVLDWWE